MEEQQLHSLLEALMPTPAYLAGALLFGILGFAAYRYGKKTGRSKTKWTGVALMFYPYLIGSDTRLLYAVGAVLCAVLYFYRD
ncbi:hypothetical protein LPB67_10785 [Undibacterium sp. Jales W-56]|uniref:hypothetical protein n=1 Tax=Undibacterium sp. Jales W-56 TaxID=2897325 RepID=UPI0021D129F7|nr:hypothetical protein [Undibacterium sp. Jales W-56]MCU6434256.1 hypothetical protein [Undibacterium sp. Jales W-56]